MKTSAVAMCMLALVASSICQIAQSPLASQLVAPTNQMSAHEKKKDTQADAGSPQKKDGTSDVTGVFGGQENMSSFLADILNRPAADFQAGGQPAVAASLPAEVQESKEYNYLEDNDLFGNLFDEEAGDS